MKIYSKDYINYLKNVYNKLQDNKEYVTNLDLATGDGDHWNNMNSGFSELLKQEEKLSEMPICELYKNIGMIMMSKIGGSSGVLYGGAYLAAANELKGEEFIDEKGVYLTLNSMLEDMMKRGNTKVGSKTMIDALYPAVKILEENISKEKKDLKEVFERVKESSIKGAEDTKLMQASRGRASYQKDKGVGHLDPGAVTMSYQIEELCNYIIKFKLGKENE